MYKLAIVLFTALVAVSAKPGALLTAPVAYTAGIPAVAAYSTPVVTSLATSSQYVARNYNGLVAAPYVASPYVASAYAASPYVASPYAAAYSTYSGYPYASAYSAYPYASAAYVV